MGVRTAFILGAGASKPYGFPTAYELKQLVLGDAVGDFSSWADRKRGQYRYRWSHWLTENLPSNIPDAAFLKEFQKRFGTSDVDSIDKFVFQHESHAETAKHLIALILLECECRATRIGDWYARLWNDVVIPRPDETHHFFTFNYDRSLEQYFDQVTNSYFKDDENGKEVRSRIRVHHIYGCLGPLCGSDNAVSYGSNNPKAIELASKQIRLIPPRSTSQDWPRDALVEFDRLVFLGFGFDELNMNALGITNNNRPKDIFASRYRLSKVRESSAQERLGYIAWGEQDHTVGEFLHHSRALVGY